MLIYFEFLEVFSRRYHKIVFISIDKEFYFNFRHE
jgi:hypothetical protein